MLIAQPYISADKGSGFPYRVARASGELLTPNLLAAVFGVAAAVAAIAFLAIAFLAVPFAATAFGTMGREHDAAIEPFAFKLGSACTHTSREGEESRCSRKNIPLTHSIHSF